MWNRPWQPFGPDDPREWLRRAKGNLRLASAKDPEVPLEELCYNAQQAAEKAIKAIFISLGKPFPYTHNLKRLLDLIAEMMPVPADVLAAGELTRFAFEARYPGVAPQITRLAPRLRHHCAAPRKVLSGGVDSKPRSAPSASSARLAIPIAVRLPLSLPR